jgi:hypothetical protein
MLPAILNWGGTILLFIGFALILGAIVYAESQKILDNTFRLILIGGIALLFIGLVIVIVGHWNILFSSHTKEKTIVQNK